MKYILAIIFTSLFLLSACAPGIEVTDFASCAEATGIIQTSYPAKCTYDGVTYVEQVDLPEQENPSGTVLAGTTQEQCEAFGGNWIADANECEGIGQEACTELGGNFNECASACRNQPEARVCTMQCVLVCEFNPNGISEPDPYEENTATVEIIEMAVDPKLHDCVGVGPMQCMLINGELFYDSIQDFDYEEGYAYEIIVTKTERLNPPADASKYLYALQDLVSRTAISDDVWDEVVPVTEYFCSNAEKQNMICTREYNPVCGDDGVTHATACTACASGTVDWYTEGEC